MRKNKCKAYYDPIKSMEKEYYGKSRDQLVEYFCGGYNKEKDMVWLNDYTGMRIPYYFWFKKGRLKYIKPLPTEKDENGDMIK